MYIYIYMNTYTIPNNCNNVKIDIGLSYSAPQSQRWLSVEPNLMVFGFEPNPESVECIKNGNIQKRAECHGEPLKQKYIDEGRIILIPKALSNVDKEESMAFYINSNDCGTSSLFNHNQQYLGPIKCKIEVQVISLQMFFDDFPWDRFEYIDYIKIDAQGSDLNILKGAGKYLSEKVVYVTAEPDGYQYQGAEKCNIENITNYMLTQNFIRINHPNTNDPTYLNNKYAYLKDKIYICQL
jgi:FkbM family methyltransferase